MRATPLDQFRTAPLGRCVSGRTWLHWCARPELWGFSLWGRPTGEDMHALVDSLVTELGPHAVTHRSLVDARRLEAAAPSSFTVLHGYVSRHSEALRGRVARLALVRPGGLAGAIVAGFYQTLRSPYPVGVFDDAVRAAAWLGEADPKATCATIDAHVERAAGATPTVAGLRAVLAARLGVSGLREAAAALGLTERTLQRRLQDGGTTFARELVQARLDGARRLMLETEASLTAIALDSGFASLQHFSAAFRAAAGETPSAWRARERAAHVGEPAGAGATDDAPDPAARGAGRPKAR